MKLKDMKEIDKMLYEQLTLMEKQRKAILLAQRKLRDWMYQEVK